MSKKIIAIAVTVLMIFSILSVIQPVNAATPPNVAVFLRPGVEDPYKPGWSQTLGTLRLHPEVVVPSYLNYAILASTETSPSIGDLQFDITLLSTYTGAVYIYLPQEFKLLAPDGSESTDLRYNVWTDITNDYNYISVGVRGAWDPGCPFCTRVRIGFTSWYPDDAADPGVTLEAGTYHVRIFNVKAPTVAGVYHFKMRLYPDYFSPNDFPIIIVKSELNPAYIVGQVGLCANGSPCTVTDTTKYGKVWAEGTTPEGRSVSAAYYFGPEDASGGLYTYWLFGVAPGTYTLYASAGGYPKSTGERLEVVMGQSMHPKTMWLLGGPTVQITVWSKHGRGELPWGNLWQPPYGNNNPNAPVDPVNRQRPISFDLYDEDGNHLVWGCSGSFNCGPYLLTDPLATSFTTTIAPDIGYTSSAPVVGGANIDAFTSGVKYKIETWVTGYVMTEEDAWQREFTVSGGAVNVEMDLRRSNYFEIQLHEIPLPSVPTSLMLAAEQDGVEKGITSLLVAQNGDLWFWNPDYAAYGPQINPNTGLPYNVNTDPVVLEGWSYRYLYDYTMDDLAWRDYGFEPGTYEIKMYMADMGDTTGKWSSLGIQGFTGQVVGKGWYTIREDDPHSGTIALCNSPSMISFRVRVNSLWLKIRSVDWESPSHPRPWLFPGAEVWIDILDENDNVVESVANDLWGVVQDDGSIGSFYACFNQDSGSWAVCPFPGEGYILTVPFTGNDYGHDTWGYPGPDIFGSGAYPTSLAAGQYHYSVHTYGYAERRNFPNVLTLGGKADIQVDLIQGGQIRINMNFYKEHVLLAGPIDFDGYVRVEVFNENDELVGASIYGQAQVNPLAHGSYLLYDSARDWKYYSARLGNAPEPAEGAGVDLIAPDGTPGYGQRAHTSWYFYGLPTTTFANYYALIPAYAQKLWVPPDGTAAFDVFGFYRYYGGMCSRNDGLWANGFDTVSTGNSLGDGLRGSTDAVGIDGGGLYTVKVWAFEPGPHWQSYYMVSDITGVEVPWGGATELYVDLEQMGRLTGSVGWTNMYGDMLAMPWLQLTATSSAATVVAYSTPMGFDPTTSLLTAEPAYMMWLPGPSDTVYSISAVATGAPASFVMPVPPPDISISPGYEASLDPFVAPTGVPVPEFPVAPLVALSALAASLYVLRRRHK